MALDLHDRQPCENVLCLIANYIRVSVQGISAAGLGLYLSLYAFFAFVNTNVKK